MTQREQMLETQRRVRELSDKGFSRGEIAARLGVGVSTVWSALRFVESDIRPCAYDPEPHEAVDHRQCRRQDTNMDFDEAEEFPK